MVNSCALTPRVHALFPPERRPAWWTYRPVGVGWEEMAAGWSEWQMFGEDDHHRTTIDNALSYSLSLSLSVSLYVCVCACTCVEDYVLTTDKWWKMFKHRCDRINMFQFLQELVAWHSGRTSVSGRRTFCPMLDLQLKGDHALLLVNHPLHVSQPGQLSLSSCRDR